MIYIELSNRVEREFTKQYGRKELRKLQSYLKEFGCIDVFRHEHILECFDLAYTNILLEVTDFVVVGFTEIELPTPEDFQQ